jgi:uncharacterized protein YjbI with pentapeptide repeats
LHRRQIAERSVLEPIVRDSSDKVRQFLFVYLLLITYVVAIVLSTTDRQLLVADQGLKLPLVDLTVPLVGFYLAIPYFVLALHFNLLHNVVQHHYKLMRWQRAWNDYVPRERLNLLIFDWASLGSAGGFSSWVRSASGWLFLYSGPTVISAVLWRFADYQSGIALAIHLAALWLDLVFVATARREIDGRSQEQLSPNDVPRSFSLLSGLSRILMAPLHAAPRSNASGFWYVCVAVIAIKLLVCIDVFVQSWEGSLVRRYAGVLLQKRDDFDRPNDLYGFLPRIQIDRTEPLFKPNLSQLKEMAEVLGHSDWRREFSSRAMTLDLRGRSLRYLSIHGQTVPRVWAHGADLQGSDLSFAVLTGSNLIDTKLQGSRLEMVDLEGAILMDANLRGANLSNARLSGAHLDRTQMQVADLTGAVLAGAVLFDVGLQGANLNGVHFDGAIVGGIQVWGARGSISRTPLLSPFRGDALAIEATAPSEAEIEHWTRALPTVNTQKAFAQYLSAVAAQPTAGATAKAALSEALFIDDQKAVEALVNAACHKTDLFHLKSSAVGSMTQVMTILSHPALQQLREKLNSPECPEAARAAARPVVMR